jgi:hypothetical protein
MHAMVTDVTSTKFDHNHEDIITQAINISPGKSDLCLFLPNLPKKTKKSAPS